MSQEKQFVPSNKTIEYILDYTSVSMTPTDLHSLKDALVAFAPTYLSRIPYASVLVTPEQEPHLLETLATMPKITYHRGQPRRAFDNSEGDGV
jgi:hypothetical protein